MIDIVNARSDTPKEKTTGLIERLTSIIRDNAENGVSARNEKRRKGVQFRHELKYFVDDNDAYLMAQSLSRTMDRDPFSRPDGRYHIRSLYFDDVFNSAFYTKLAGVEERKKYRIRIYNLNDDVIKLECKQKLGQFIHKRTCSISRKTAEEMIAGNPSPLINYANPLANEVYFAMRTSLLRPVVIVDYEREAFIGKTQDVRITFDRDLRTAYRAIDMFDKTLPTVRPEFEFYTILEVKFNDYLPELYRALLQVGRANRVAASKYVMCRRFEA